MRLGVPIRHGRGVHTRSILVHARIGRISGWSFLLSSSRTPPVGRVLTSSTMVVSKSERHPRYRDNPIPPKSEFDEITGTGSMCHSKGGCCLQVFCLTVSSGLQGQR